MDFALDTACFITYFLLRHLTMTYDSFKQKRHLNFVSTLEDNLAKNLFFIISLDNLLLAACHNSPTFP